MRVMILALATLASLTSQTRAGTALDALRLLPEPQWKTLAIIEGRDGAPAPERWYLLVQDSTAENGYREFVVEGGQILVSRSVSQFAENLRPQDVVGADAVKIDSDRLLSIAQQFAGANNFVIGKIDYELKKSDAAAGAVWKLSCRDESGGKTAELIVSANKGNVVSHEGFARVPQREAERVPQREIEKEARGPRTTAGRKPNDKSDRQDGGPHTAIGRTLFKIFGGGKKDDR